VSPLSHAPGRFGRRTLLGAFAALSALPLFAAQGSRPVAAVSLDWGLSETLFAMGLAPLGASLLRDFARTPGQPAVPGRVVDVGLSSAPNLELLQTLRPDVLLLQSWQEPLRPTLERIAPVQTFTLYTGDGHPLQRSFACARQLGDVLDIPQAGEQYAQSCRARLHELRESLAPWRGQDICLLQQIDGHHLSVFARGGLFHDVLEYLGLRNAWQAPADLLWGGSQIELAQLAELDADRVLVINGQEDGDTLYGSALWQQLPFVAAGKASFLPFVWGFGALPSALRFAELLNQALQQGTAA
jgi:iron complex transport system substrate-binding protein